MKGKPIMNNLEPFGVHDTRHGQSPWAMVDAPVNTVKARYDWERDQLDIVTIDGDQVRLDARQAAALAHWLVALAIPHAIEGGAA